MDCSPSCDVHLGELRTASIRPRLDVCSQPAVLTLIIKIGGKIAKELFVAGNDVEVRPILSNRLDLNLRVKFEHIDGTYHAESCLENVQSGNISCFLNDTLYGDASLCSNRNGQTNSEFIWILLSIVLVTCLLFIGISVFTMMNKFNSYQKSSRRPSKLSIEKIAVPRKTSNSLVTPVSGDSNTYLLSPNYYFDERLAVIAEVDEKLSEASFPYVESSNSISQRAEQRKLSAESATKSVQKTTILCQKDQVILPQNLNHACRNSQLFTFPTSSSLDSIQNKPHQPSSFAV